MMRPIQCGLRVARALMGGFNAMFRGWRLLTTQVMAPDLAALPTRSHMCSPHFPLSALRPWHVLVEFQMHV